MIVLCTRTFANIETIQHLSNLPIMNIEIRFKLTVCFIACLFTSGLTGCSENNAEKEDKKKFAAASDSDGGFEKGLMDKMQQLGTLNTIEMQTRDKEQKIKINQQRSALASDLLKNKNLTEQFRQACVMTKAQALLRRIALGDQPDELRKTLMDFSNQYVIDDNPEISRIARMSKVSLMASDLINDKLENPNRLVTGLVELIDLYPENEITIQEVTALIDKLWKSKHRNVAVQLMQQVIPVIKRNPNEINDRLVGLFESRIRLEQYGFVAGADKQLGAPGKITQEFKDAISKTLADTEFSEIMYAELSNVIRRLEINNEYQALMFLYDQMQQRTGNWSNEELKKKADETIAKGRQRIALINQPFRLNAVDLQGSPINPQSFAGKPTIVMFVTIRNNQVLQELGYMEAVHNELASKGVNMIVACIDENRQTIARTFANSKGKWVLATNPTDSNQPKLADAFGIQQIPYIFLVSSKGRVTEINIPAPKVKDKVNQLLYSFNDRDSDRRYAISMDVLWSSQMLAGMAAAFGQANIATINPAHFGHQDEDDSNQRNVYLAPARYNTKELVDYLLDLDYKPRSIQNRIAFVDAVLDTADRILKDDDAKIAWQRIAALTCAKHLQAKAALEEDGFNDKLIIWIKRIKSIENETVQKEVEFLELEQSLLDAQELSFEEIKALIEKSKQYCQSRELEQKHLRLASLTVQMINRIDRVSNTEEDAKTRTEYFETFGELFAKSEDKRLARYGKSLAKTNAAASSQWMGKPLTIDGTNLAGNDFNWESYRGKIVLVDFWATWCGPCRKSIPAIAELHKRLGDSGFEVVGVNLDADPETALKYVQENGIEWENLGSDGAKSAAETYGVSAIPTMMLIDPEGNIVAIEHQLAKLETKITQQLERLDKR